MNIIAYTDGACSGNPGPGGYGAIMKCGKGEREVRGHVSGITTNNRMELQAVIAVIDWLNRVQKSPCNIQVYTDSQYIVDCTSHKSKDWFTNRKNSDLWMELIEKGNKGKHRITFVKVKGHSDDELNARVDAIAREECQKAKEVC